MLRKAANNIVASRTSSVLLRVFSSGSSHSGSSSSINTNVAGLSEKCVNVPDKPVGPGASKNNEYKNPEYFCYHQESFAEAEVELAKYRLPPPSNKVPFNR